MPEDILDRKNCWVLEQICNGKGNEPIMHIYETLDNGITIVEYEDSLAPSIAHMWNESKDDWGSGTGVWTASQVISREAVSTNFNVFCAMDGDEVVGYCSFSRFFGDSETLYIPTLGVRPDYQGKKIGKALILLCLRRTAELG